MPPKKNNPEEKALGDVEKAYRDLEKASKKVDDLQAKRDEAEATRARADKTLIWAASHPDLPDDFSLEEFVADLREPFKEGEEDSAPDVADDLQVAAVAGARADLDESQEERAEENFVGNEDADPFSDDVFGDVGEPEPEAKPAPRARRSSR